MYSFCFYLHKGGTGKSSISVLVGQALGLLEKKVILIDGDTQGNASTQLLESSEYAREQKEESEKVKELIPFELADVLKGNCYVKEAIKKVRKNLWILPTRPTAHSSLINYAENQLPNELFAFEDLNDELKKLNFEYIIYDMSPASGTLESRILKSINEAIAVTNIGMFSIKGLGGFIKFRDEIQRKSRVSIKWDKIIINKTNESYKHTKKGKEAIGQLKIKNYIVPQDITIEALQENYKTILDGLNPKDLMDHKTMKGLVPFIKDLIKEGEKYGN